MAFVFNPRIFREYDIRGRVATDLTPALAEQVGWALGAQLVALKQSKVIIGRDGRLSSEDLSKALAQGLLASGIDVVDLGMVTTPMVYFAAKTLPGVNSCVVITGSHNPPDYNGIKMVLDDVTLSGAAIQSLAERIRQQDYVEGQGGYSKLTIFDDYQQTIHRRIKLARPLKIVVDAGNGVAGATSPAILRGLGCEVIELFCQVDGRFPNHHPDPAQPKNLADLIEAVKRHQADIGLAFDGDGDRCGVVDEQGQVLYADRQMMLYAEDVLHHQPGATILFDIKCSSLLAKHIQRFGGQPLMWKTGHSLMKAKMRETGAALGGELSGHLFFADHWFGFDDGTYSAARMLQIVAAQTRLASQLFAELPKGYSTPELELQFEEGGAHAFMQTLLASPQFPDAELCTLDGLRADFKQGWGLVRASNTSSNLVMRFEGETPAALERVKQQFREALLAVNSELNLPF
ncbi:phosphomannomutase/phosphoglucomutase [Thiomicrospira microaerophila]|uniref:phosphomannomutase/phosphoglucomutase n=1 Tax=Thiomicrospira microaerophila TaxID=406020 RepID=UPI00200F2F6F|nr:phosphomannomutase/phosphoglucomutase [Thiomicrospira microaerophila]UQB41972.1 phosphomannomutase/phosphoglucomutase [Thiomicrospira microaerophila]